MVTGVIIFLGLLWLINSKPNSNKGKKIQRILLWMVFIISLLCAAQFTNVLFALINNNNQMISEGVNSSAFQIDQSYYEFPIIAGLLAVVAWVGIRKINNNKTISEKKA